MQVHKIAALKMWYLEGGNVSLVKEVRAGLEVGLARLRMKAL